jgi:hypothetical protein
LKTASRITHSLMHGIATRAQWQWKFRTSVLRTLQNFNQQNLVVFLYFLHVQPKRSHQVMSSRKMSRSPSIPFCGQQQYKCLRGFHSKVQVPETVFWSSPSQRCNRCNFVRGGSFPNLRFGLSPSMPNSICPRLAHLARPFPFPEPPASMQASI